MASVLAVVDGEDAEQPDSSKKNCCVYVNCKWKANNHSGLTQILEIAWIAQRSKYKPTTMKEMKSWNCDSKVWVWGTLNHFLVFLFFLFVLFISFFGIQATKK